MYAETTVPGAGSYSVMVEVEGNSEKIKKNAGMAEEWSGMRWYIKQNKKRKWSI